ncbi:hypothetical protein C8K30_115120 [Promicromonospora sp. AC04]|nr:hypothetical protein C8K30_115120 [Promicromonospora sp. AC04]
MERLWSTPCVEPVACVREAPTARAIAAKGQRSSGGVERDEDRCCSGLCCSEGSGEGPVLGCCAIRTPLARSGVLMPARTLLAIRRAASPIVRTSRAPWSGSGATASCVVGNSAVRGSRPVELRTRCAAEEAMTSIAPCWASRACSITSRNTAPRHDVCKVGDALTERLPARHANRPGLVVDEGPGLVGVVGVGQAVAEPFAPYRQVVPHALPEPMGSDRVGRFDADELCVVARVFWPGFGQAEHLRAGVSWTVERVVAEGVVEHLTSGQVPLGGTAQKPWEWFGRVSLPCADVLLVLLSDIEDVRERVPAEPGHVAEHLSPGSCRVEGRYGPGGPAGFGVHGRSPFRSNGWGGPGVGMHMDSADPELSSDVGRRHLVRRAGGSGLSRFRAGPGPVRVADQAVAERRTAPAPVVPGLSSRGGRLLR